MDRAKIRAAAENVLSAGKMNVMLLPCAEVIALLTALDAKEAALTANRESFRQYAKAAEAENKLLREALAASEAELQITCSCCKLFKDCHLPCRLNDIRETNKVALTQKGGK